MLICLNLVHIKNFVSDVILSPLTHKFRDEMEKPDEPLAPHLSSSRKNDDLETVNLINIENDTVLEQEETVEKDFEIDITKNPLKNPLIIHYIFNLLDLSDIKQCRLVCNKWNELSFSFLEKMSAISLGVGHTFEEDDFKECSPKAFSEFSRDSAINFHAFKLENPEFYSDWPIETLVGFLEDQNQNMRELTIDGIKVKNHSWEFDPSFKNYFSITPYITNHLTHLAIKNYSRISSKFMVSIDKLTSTKSLSFVHCAVELVEGCKLAPTNFEMDHVALIKDGKMMKSFVLNELIDFKNLKELTLCGNTESRNDRSDPYLHRRFSDVDLPGNLSLKKLSLNDVIIPNLEESEWKINKLKLRYLPIVKEHSKIQFTELDFGNSTINLDALPQSIEKLTLRWDFLGPMCCGRGQSKNIKIVCPPLFSRPNLKHLELFTDREPFASNDESEYEEETDDDQDCSEESDNNEDKDDSQSMEFVNGNKIIFRKFKKDDDVTDDEEIKEKDEIKENNEVKDVDGSENDSQDDTDSDEDNQNDDEDDNEDEDDNHDDEDDNEDEDDNQDDEDDNEDEDENNEVHIHEPTENPLSYLNLFAECQSLTTVKLVGSIPIQSLHTDWIPRSTKYLFLAGKIIATGEEFKLERLVFENYDLKNLITTLEKLKSKLLVLDLEKYIEGEKAKIIFGKVEKIILTVINNMSYESLFIGSLKISEADFHASRFSKYVDKNAEYYLFKNQRGKSIEGWEFKKMTDI